MKTIIIILISILFIINNNELIAANEHPSDDEFAGTNLRLDGNVWQQFGLKGAWTVQNLQYDGGDFVWGNWRCNPPGGECRRGDWLTRWASISSPTQPGDGWWQNDEGEWEPPLPDEEGLWESYYFLNVPENYDPETGLYY